MGGGEDCKTSPNVFTCYILKVWSVRRRVEKGKKSKAVYSYLLKGKTKCLLVKMKQADKPTGEPYSVCKENGWVAQTSANKILTSQRKNEMLCSISVESMQKRNILTIPLKK